jgi:plasmid stability protein
MRTTLDLPDNLLRRLKSRAALEGSSLKDLVRQLVERGLEAQSMPARGHQRSELPTIPSRAPLAIRNPSNARLFELLDEEDQGR